MAIYSIGHDIVKISRIEKLLENNGTNFIQKILSIAEQELITHKKYQVAFIAKRFAAKEAFAKACGTGLVSPITLTNISVLNDDLGCPYLVLSDSIKEWLKLRNIRYCHVSISDQEDMASAVVILEK